MISAGMVKDLRNRTGAGIMDCKEALKAASGDVEEAIDYLRTKGQIKAAKKEGRTTGEGLVGSYIHAGGKIGVLTEVCCETDFVAKTDDFSQLVKDLAMQIAASNPTYISPSEVPAETLEKEREILRAEALEAGKPEKIIDRIVEGRIKKYYEENCLIEQPFIKDNDVKVGELLSKYMAKLGENITVKRFARYKVGADGDQQPQAAPDES